MTKSSFTIKGEIANNLLALIHTDVCVPMNTSSIGGFQYFITFADDYIRNGYMYIIEATQNMPEHIASWKIQQSRHRTLFIPKEESENINNTQGKENG